MENSFVKFILLNPLNKRNSCGVASAENVLKILSRKLDGDPTEALRIPNKNKGHPQIKEYILYSNEDVFGDDVEGFFKIRGYDHLLAGHGAIVAIDTDDNIIDIDEDFLLDLEVGYINESDGEAFYELKGNIQTLKQAN